MKAVRVGIFALLGVSIFAGAAVAFLRPEWIPAGFGLNQGRAKDYGLYCKEHGVPEKFCTLCHPELKEKLLLCPEHGNIPEDICTLCHPEVKEKHDVEVCPEHGLPKHFCVKCDEKAGKPRASADVIDDGWCVAFGETKADGKKVCTTLPRVRLATAELAKELGIQTALVTRVQHMHELQAPAETAYDANRYAEITPRVSAFVREARVDLGQKVGAGEVVAVVDSAEVSSAKAQYLSGKATLAYEEDNFRRVDSLTKSELLRARERPLALSALNQARATTLGAEQKLRNFRFGDADLAGILKSSDTNPLLEITSPIDGTVVFRHAVVGEGVEPSTKLYTVADISKLWLWIDVFERDIRSIKPGQGVHFTVYGSSSASEETTVTGKITWVGTEVNEKTRTTKVRAEVPNPDGSLRANQFGRARIRIGEEHMALTVPKAAVQRYEGVDLVFLQERPGVYRPQRIKTKSLGRGDAVEVAWGLEEGQEVVTAGAFLLKTEVMKGSIGAGCCE